MANLFTAAINRLSNKITNLVARVRITKTVQVDNNDHLIMQVEGLGQTGNMEVVFPYGMSGNPPKDSMVLRFNSQGAAGNRIGIPFDPSNKIKGSLEGEVIIGNPIIKTYFKFTAAGLIEVWSLDTLIEADLATWILFMNTHVHADPVSGTTGGPIAP